MNTVFHVGDVVQGKFSGRKYLIVEICTIASTDGYYKSVCVESGRINTILCGFEDGFTLLEMATVRKKESGICEKCGTEMSDHYSYGLGETIKKCQKCGWMK